jgi:hypothetical protein
LQDFLRISIKHTMKTLTFEVSITFTGRIKDFELQEVTNNLADAIHLAIDRGHGVSPEESEAVTKSIKVKETLSGCEKSITIF